jgi:hypothetical protein
MRILSRKKLEFKIDEKGSAITVEPLVFTEVPESAKLDPLFGWALKDGSIEVIETVEQQKKLENEPVAPVVEPEAPTELAEEESKPSKKK